MKFTRQLAYIKKNIPGTNRNRWISAILMMALGAGLCSGTNPYFSNPYYLAAAAEEAYETSMSSTPQTEDNLPVVHPQRAASSEADEDIHIASLDELNLAYLFPESDDDTDFDHEFDEESDNGTDRETDNDREPKSYAERIYETLSLQDQIWFAGIYDYSDMTPLSLAHDLGLSADTVTGDYNPNESSHDSNDPSTWVIGSFRNIRLHIVDGDGNPIGAYSNVTDIMSLANTYTYYTGAEDHEYFLEYAKTLWEASHSYHVSISDIYYCDGCLDEESQEREMARLLKEAVLEQEESAEEDAEPEYAQRSADEEYAQEGVEETHEDGQKEDVKTEPAQDETASIQTADEAEESTGNSTVITSHFKHRKTAGESESEETSSAETSGVIVSGAARAKEEAESSITIIEGDEDEKNTSIENEIEAEEKTQTEEVSAEDGEREGLTETASASDATERVCPGHVDLILNIRINGLDETNNLFTIDSIGNNTENIADDGWPGWNEETIGAARALSSIDWYERYGMTISSIIIANPLSQEEIDSYLALLPENLSSARRSVIKTALSSVGKIPYYWGRKPAAAGYEGNYFGSLQPPDEDGRILRGLDCSGWISWVYWTATGERLPYESTSGLAISGRRIGRDELKPGDIIVRTGTDAHVIMFLAWTDDGRILCIHESSNGINNVTVAIRDANWPYYRNLID